MVASATRIAGPRGQNPVGPSPVSESQLCKHHILTCSDLMISCAANNNNLGVLLKVVREHQWLVDYRGWWSPRMCVEEIL